jgi:hypothetical protein
MLIPNYPDRHNNSPMFNRTEIRNVQKVNLWNANCFLFGSIENENTLIRFKHWKDPVFDDWHISVDPSGLYIEVTGVTQRNDKNQGGYLPVSGNLAVNVIYRLASSTYRMNVDDAFLHNSVTISYELEQRFYFAEQKKDSYRLYVPYQEFPITSGTKNGISFYGRKARNSRLPYDVSSFFK